MLSKAPEKEHSDIAGNRCEHWRASLLRLIYQFRCEAKIAIRGPMKEEITLSFCVYGFSFCTIMQSLLWEQTGVIICTQTYSMKCPMNAHVTSYNWYRASGRHHYPPFLILHSISRSSLIIIGAVFVSPGDSRRRKAGFGAVLDLVAPDISKMMKLKEETWC